MKLLRTAGWLVMAAALTITMAACSGDDTLAGEPTTPTGPEAVSSVHVTLGAGLGSDNGATRSDVTLDAGFSNGGGGEGMTRTDVITEYGHILIFTEGDRLYVTARVSADNSYLLAGTLSVGDITDRGQEATFSGDLQVYHYEGGTPVPSSYTFTNDDPLLECTDHCATLISKDMREDCYTINANRAFQFDYSKSIASGDPEDGFGDRLSMLMTTAIRVQSFSYMEKYMGGESPIVFRNFEADPIIQCSIGDLEGSTDYTVTLKGDTHFVDYYSYTGSFFNLTFDPPVTTSSDGCARFAISLKPSDIPRYWSLTFTGGSENRCVMLGEKQLDYEKAYYVGHSSTELVNPMYVAVVEPEAIDMGKGIKWSSMNLGATSETEYGDYFAWGETWPYYTMGSSQESPCTHWIEGKMGYYWPSYSMCKGNSSSITKYFITDGQYTMDQHVILKPEDDAARVHRGGKWRIPTDAEWDSLRVYSTWTWTTLNGVNGHLVRSTVPGYTDNTIFLPAAGYRYIDTLESVGSMGAYWSSTLRSDTEAYYTNFTRGGPLWNWATRFRGYSIRPVRN